MPVPEEVIFTFIQDLLVNALEPLVDEAYQRRVWFRAEGSECSTYIDVTIHFIDRCEKIFSYPTCESYLGKENYDLLQKLYQLIDHHVNSVEQRIDPDLLEEDELLNDPKWKEIQMLASEVDLKLTDFVKRQNHD